MPLLEIKKIGKRFGGIKAVDELSFHMDKKEILGVMGPNGSGKSTTFDLIMGFQKIDFGEIFFRKKSITKWSTHKIVRSGIGRTFQITRVFGRLTTLENLLVPYCGSSENGISRREKASKLLKFLNIFKLRNELACNLSFGQQKLVEFGRVLMSDPDLILLDEPIGGVNPVLAEKILSYIKKLRERGKTFIVIEHKLDVLEKISDRIIVLDYGRKIAEGTLKDLQQNKKVIDAYLGVG